MKAEKHFDRLPQEERQLIALNVTKAIYEYLQLFLSPIIARRIISAILIIAGVHSTGITQLTGLCERSIRDLKNQIAAGNTDSLFEIKSGRGRKSKFKDVESQIVGEIERGNFKSFRNAIDSIIDGTNNIFKDQVAKLIGEKIQLYDNFIPVCENTFSAENQETKQAA